MAKKSGATSDRVFLQNAIKTLVANIRFASVDKPISTIAVTSSIPNEGKTSISIQLAMALASSGNKVLLMECDLRRRSIASSMNLHSRDGLYAVLSGQAEITSAVLSTSTRGLYFLDCEPHIPNPVDILASQRFKQLMGSLKSEFDYVVVDTPPLSVCVDAAVIGAEVDGVLLVCRQDFVKRDDLLAAFDQLQKAGANVIGSVLNFCESERNEYYYSYYNKDGKRVRKSEASSSDAPVVAPKAAPPRKASPAASASAPAQAAPQAKASAAAPASAAAAPAKAAAAPAKAEARSAAARPAQASQAPAAETSVRRVVVPSPATPQGSAAAAARPATGASAAPDSTAQFLVGAGYTPRSYDYDE